MEQFPTSEKTNEQKSENELRIEHETAIAEDFKAKGYIDSYEIYQDAKGYGKKDFSSLPEHIQWEVETLAKKFLPSPVLKDSLDEKFDEQGRVIKGTRNHIKDAVNKEGGKSRDVWYTNKLEGSFTENALNVLFMLSQQEELSDAVMKTLQELRGEFSDPNDPLAMKAAGYYTMSREEKYDFERRFTAMMESVLDEVFKKYNTPDALISGRIQESK